MTSEMPIEFSRPLPVAEITGEPSAHAISATQAECAALATRLDLIALASLGAEIDLVRVGADEVLVSGAITARLTQKCVVTFAPAETDLDERFELRFGLNIGSSTSDVIIDGLADEPPEPLTGPTIDIGEIATQQLSLSLDPYPRAPEAEFRAYEAGESESDAARDADREQSGPFAALASLRDRIKEDR